MNQIRTHNLAPLSTDDWAALQISWGNRPCILTGYVESRQTGSTGPLSDLRYRQVRLDLGFIVRMRARQAPLPPISIGYSRPSSWPERSHAGMATKISDYGCSGLDRANTWTNMFWFVIFGFVAKCVFHCMFDGMQDSSISTKTWSCKID